MQDDANSGWLYHIGDMIFGDVLLVGCNGLRSVCSVYSSNVSTVENLNINQNEFELKYDCIIINSIDYPLPSKAKILELHENLNCNGVIAIVSNNDSSFSNVKNLRYLIFLFTKLFVFFCSFFNNDSLSKITYYLQSDCSRINEVFYSEGYKPVKNSFLFKEKIRKLLLGKFTFRIFSSNILSLYFKNGKNNKTIIENIISKVDDECGYKFNDINRCVVIPYKVLVSVSTYDKDDYIFLLLRGSDKNVRANKELNTLNYLNVQYPALKPFISNSITSGIYKNVEYIVYRELSGVLIDSVFNKFHLAERAGFKMLLFVGDISSSKNVITNSLFLELSNGWFNKIKTCFDGDDIFNNYIDNIKSSLLESFSNESCRLILFHGDYKIENLLFDTQCYSVKGIIDWDLSEKQHFPALDLIYFIIYNRRIRNSSSFLCECEAVFLKDGFNLKEKKMIDEYCIYFDLSNEKFKLISIMFLIHHFSCRERSGHSAKWLINLFDCVYEH